MLCIPKIITKTVLFKEKCLSGKKEKPPVITMFLPNDHGANECPADGYPFRESYMADNDSAL